LGRYVITTCILVLGCASLFACRTEYISVRRRLPGERVKEGQVVEKAVVGGEDSLRSSNYRFGTPLPKAQLDKIMAAMEQYHLQLFKAVQPKWKKLPEYVDVYLPGDKLSFTQLLEGDSDTVVDPDFVAVVPSKRKIVVLRESNWTQFTKRLFRAQARIFFEDCMPDLPLWLEEGFASFFEEVIIGGKGADTAFKIVGHNAKKLAIVQALIRDNELPALSDVMAISDRSKLTDSDRLAMWAFMYWSQHSGGPTRRTFTRYLKAIIRDGYENVSLEEYLKMSLGIFEKRWKAWLGRQEVYKPIRPRDTSGKQKQGKPEKPEGPGK
jgi:hypothetical protein